MYDLIILGAGPAGMTAAIYAARRKVNFLIIGSIVGGQMIWTSEIENYPGYTFISGEDLIKKFEEHMEEYNIELKTENILELKKNGDECFVKTDISEYTSKSVIIATGQKPKKLGIPGEDKFIGKGISYCATCDAPLYKEKIVSVLGGGNSGLEAALFLSKYASKVYLLEYSEKITGEPYLKDRVFAEDKIEVIVNAKTKEIFGENTVKSIKYEVDGEEKNVNVDGIFIEIGLITEANFTDVEKNEWGEIKIFRDTRTHEENKTSISGIYAAGDCTDIVSKQIVAAAGEGCKAALASLDYILR